jgi:transposase-like protein
MAYPISLKKRALAEYQSRRATVGKISKKYGVSPATLTCWVKRANLPIRGRGRPRTVGPTSRQRAILSLAEIVKIEAIGKSFGMTKQGVSRIVRRRGRDNRDRELQPP